MPILELSRTDAPDARARALVFEAPASRELLRRIERLAPTDAPVLITGATGTGKEIAARHLHDQSGRAGQPFVAVNCGALTPSLLESELFGHERGAFTGAIAGKAGWFETADKGTLFLDEVGDLPLDAQVKLLRVLQEREVVRVGARRAIAVDVRLVAATNVQLERAVAQGRFREDLYYRLHVAHLRLAPLRERREDIVPLANHFLRVYAARLGIEAPEFTEGAFARLLVHPWPGNIRELENVIYRALLVSHEGRVTSSDLQLPDETIAGPANVAALAEPSSDPASALEAALLTLFETEQPRLHEQIEAVLFRAAYRFSEKNQLRTARLLGISRNVVRARLLQHGLLAPAPPTSAIVPVNANEAAWARPEIDRRSA
jgi:sigma-54-specific transcriptional regulator